MSRKLTKEEFVEKAKKVHKDKYNYDNFVYVNNKIKGIITCEKHGDFEQSPRSHLSGNGCPECAKEKSKSNLEEFVEKANKIHNNFYDYSNVDYKHSQKKIKIICPIHGVFEQSPNSHLNGNGCPKCAKEKLGDTLRSNLEEFIEKANKIHNNFYDYSNTDYINALKKIKIICPIHGEFEQRAADHLNGRGCPKCAKEKTATARTSNLEEFIEKANKIHNNFYDYSNTDYINALKKIKIICPIHGEFEQRAASHLRGSGCPKCAGNSKSNSEEFVQKAKKVHNNFYDYSKVDYILSQKKVKIICPIHGVFEQTPRGHLGGHGCPKCANEKTVERNRILNRIKWFDRYDEGILYLIECWNDVERFVKIGLTSKSVEERYNSSKSMPYNYFILKEVYTDSNTVSDTEQYIINFYESYKPKISFKGDSECLEISEKFQIIEFLENLEKDLEVS